MSARGYDNNIIIIVLSVFRVRNSVLKFYTELEASKHYIIIIIIWYEVQFLFIYLFLFAVAPVLRVTESYMYTIYDMIAERTKKFRLANFKMLKFDTVTYGGGGGLYFIERSLFRLPRGVWVFTRARKNYSEKY